MAHKGADDVDTPSNRKIRVLKITKIIPLAF